VLSKVMCGIYIYPETIEKNVTTEESVKKRGPDGYNTLIRGGYVFNHALLSLTGGYTLQPANNEDFTILFNGEIYNYKKLGDFSSEIDCLSSLYEKLYLDLPKEVDGEYVIVVFDWMRSEVVIFSDVFGTKPMFVNLLDQGIELASVPSVNSRFDRAYTCDIPPNSVTVIGLESRKIKARFNHHFFNLSQTVNDFDGWNEAFLGAIKKRLPAPRPSKEPETLFIGLSSGYDSGCIAAILNNINAKFTAYTVMNPGIWEDIFKRSKLITNNSNHILLSDHRKTPFSFDEPEDFTVNMFSG
jgi:asparagine synthetase B (glutamine-hydrolysing)